MNLIGDYIQKLDWKIKENSNMGYSLQGLNNYISSDITSKYWLNKIYSEEAKNAHNSGDIHIHDLGLLSVYCMGHDLQDLLAVGFKGVSGKVASSPPKHFRTALGQVVNFIFTLQGEAAGAQAFSNFDTLLAPFIWADELSYKEVKQALQEFVFNVNIPTRVGFQSPFFNISMDLQCPSTLANQEININQNTYHKTYKSFQKEMDMINEAFAEVMIEGDADGRVFTFPIPTYNITKDFDWDNPNLEMIWKMTGKYGIPYFSNYVNSDMSPEDARSMCPLDGKEKILFKSTRGRELEYSEIRRLYEGAAVNHEYEIYSNGKFIKATLNKFSNQKMLNVVLENNHKIKMSEEHLNYVCHNGNDKTLKGEELTNEMYLPYSLNIYEGEGGNYDMGYFVGAYAGDGSFDRDTSVVFSLHQEYKKEIVVELIRIAQYYFGAHYTITQDKKTRLLTLKVHSKAAVGLCRDFVKNMKREKHYDARVFGMSIDFRKGVFAGHYATDGGNRNRIYTSSIKMTESLNMLAATMGTTTNIYKDDREGRLGIEPNYAVLTYKLNREKYGKIWFKKNNKLWIKIKKVEKAQGTTAYCFEVKSGEPIFTVGTTGILTHNCRLRLDNRELLKRGGGLFGANPLTGSIGIVTINMARMGYLAENEKEFISKLENNVIIAIESLVRKRKLLEELTNKNLYPYTSFYLRNIKKNFGKYWKNHFSTIGIIGMNEACKNLNYGDIGSNFAKGLSLRVMDIINNMLLDAQEKTGDLWNLEATPGEGCCHSLALKDKKLYPEIYVANEADYREGAAPYYTNSTQLPVNYTDDLHEALTHQDELQAKYTGGTVHHIFLGEKVDDIETVKNLVKKVTSNFKLPYFTLTPTFSICPSHGYLNGKQEACPICDSITEVYSRVVGYLRPIASMNLGKKAELKDRKIFEPSLVSKE